MKKLFDPITLGLAGLLLLFGVLNFWKCQEAQAGGLQPPVPMYGDGVVRSLGVGPGGILTDGGINGNVTATGTTTPRSLANRAIDRGVSALDFGAKCDGVTDDAAAIQAALDYVGRPVADGGLGGGVVNLPVGTCLVSPYGIRLRYPKTLLRGAGREQTIISHTGTGPAVIIAGAMTPTVQYGPAMPASGRFPVLMGNSNWVVLEDDPTFDSYTYPLTTVAFGGNYTVVDGGLAQTNGIFGSYGALAEHSNGYGTDAGSQENWAGAFSLGLIYGQLQAQVRVDGGVYTVTDPDAIAANRQYYVEVDYDGSHLWLYRNEGDGGTVTPRANVEAGPGGITRSPWEITQFGGNPRLALGNAEWTQTGPHGYIGEFGIWNHYLHDGGSFAPIAYIGATGTSTGITGAISVDTLPASIPQDVNREMLIGGRRTLPGGAPSYLWHDGTYPNTVDKDALVDLSVTSPNQGIVVVGGTHSRVEHVSSTANGEALQYLNNSYFSIVNDVFTGGKYSPTVRIQQASNSMVVRNLETTGGSVGIFVSGTAASLTAVDSYANWLTNIWLQGASSIWSSVLLDSGGTDEGLSSCSNFVASMIVDSQPGLSMTGGGFGQGCTGSPTFYWGNLSGDNSTSGTLTQVLYNSLPTTTQNYFNGTWAAGSVTCLNCWRPGADVSPFAMGDAGVMIDDLRGTRTSRP